jgi:hypothetical protein
LQNLLTKLDKLTDGLESVFMDENGDYDFKGKLANVETINATQFFLSAFDKHGKQIDTLCKTRGLYQTEKPNVDTVRQEKLFQIRWKVWAAAFAVSMVTNEKPTTEQIIDKFNTDSTNAGITLTDAEIKCFENDLGLIEREYVPLVQQKVDERNANH